MHTDATTEAGGWARLVLATALGGAWGGVLVGLLEATLIVATAGPSEEYWLFPYAVVSYGLLGLLIGICPAVVVGIGRRWWPSVARDAAGGGAAAVFAVLGAAVARYNVVQRVFHEELDTFSATGIVVHIGVLAAALGSGWAILRVGRAVQRMPRGAAIGTAALVGCVVISTAAAGVASKGAQAPAPLRTTSAAAKGHPNVILIIADTLRADALGVYGARPSPSPVIDGFAQTAVRFEQAYSQSTWTRPSIATILTSLYPSVHGATHKLDALPDRVTTLAEAFRANGYWTAGFVTNINVAPIFNFQQGYDEYTYLQPDFYFWASDSATRLAIYKGLRVVRERAFRDRIYFYNYYQDAAVLGDAVGQWLEQRPPSPFFLLLHYMDPHDPYFEIPYNGHGVARVTNPDPPAARRDELHKLYVEDVAYLDAHLEDLFKRLKAHDLYDNTVIAFTADHGEEFQEHGGWWHGTTLYQEEMHVPLIVKRAHEPQAGSAESRVVRSLDVAPTIMAAAGLAPPASFEGHDLFTPPSGEPEPLFAEEDLEGNVLNALRIGPWKIVTANPNNPRGLHPVELYNLDEDPSEHRNLAPEQPAKTEELLRLLARERAQIMRRES